MPISKEKRGQLKNLGDIHWKTALEKGYYHDQLLYNKIPEPEILRKEVIEECTNTKVKFSNAPNGILFNVILDREFLINKAIRHLLYCFTDKEQLDKFIDEAWNIYQERRKADKLKRTSSTLSNFKNLPKNEIVDMFKILASELDIDVDDFFEADKVS